jgi:hypothetical protein
LEEDDAGLVLLLDLEPFVLFSPVAQGLAGPVQELVEAILLAEDAAELVLGLDDVCAVGLESHGGLQGLQLVLV